MKILNVAVIGVGAMGKHHARNYYEIEGVNLTAICDLDKVMGGKIARLYNAKFYSDHKELIKNERLDAVSIAVPTKFHKTIALDFIKNDIHTLIEKPLALNLKEASEILDISHKKNIVLSVGHIERFNPVIIKLKKLIKDGAFGEILSIVVKRVGLFPPRKIDTDVVTDLAVHDLDIIVHLIGFPPKSVFARGGSAISERKEDHVEIFLDYGKFGCFIQANWITPIKIRTLAITGIKGYAELNYITQKLDIYKTNYRTSQPVGFQEFLTKFGKPKKRQLNLDGTEPLKLELTNFINSVRGKEKVRVGGEEGIRAVMLSEKILQSIKTKKIVFI